MNKSEAKKLLVEYREIQKQAKAIREKEVELRKKIASYLLKGKGEGTHKFDFGDFEVKAVKKMNYSLDDDLLSTLWEDMSNEEREAVKFKPSLVIREYKQIEPESRETLDLCVVVKPGMPTISIIDKE